MATRREDLESYLEKHGIRAQLKDCLNALLHALPEEPTPFIIDFFSTGGDRPATTNMLGSDITFMDDNSGGGLGLGADEDDEDEWTEEEDTEEEEDELGDLPTQEEEDEEERKKREKIQSKGRRGSVSSESVQNGDMANTKFPAYDKEPEARTRINEILSGNILCKHLESGPMLILTNAMFKKEMKPGEVIITQGDDGDNFYIIEEGTSDVYVKGIEAITPAETEGEQTHEAHGGRVQVTGPGDSFGELALMYTSPRAATVMARTDMVLWGVDRQTFRAIIMSATVKKRSLHGEFLGKIPLMSTLEKLEKETIIDCMEEEKFTEGGVIIKQGDLVTSSDKFYIVTDGEVVVTQTPEGGEEKEICRLGQGAYFGELALLTNQARKATITAVGDVTVVSVARKVFTRVMGPLRETLKRNMKLYNSLIKL